jgi:hypothetical protein
VFVWRVTCCIVTCEYRTQYSYILNLSTQGFNKVRTAIFDVNSDIVDDYKNEDLKMDCLRPKHVVIDKKVKHCD